MHPRRLLAGFSLVCGLAVWGIGETLMWCGRRWVHWHSPGDDEIPGAVAVLDAINAARGFGPS